MALGLSEGSVIQLTHRVPMASNDRASTRDFFVDLGARHGVRTGDTLEVSRTIPIWDSINGQFSHTFRLVLGEATVVATSENVSLAREKQLVDPLQLPAMNYHKFMLGDIVSILHTPK